ncbi:MAG TPA: tRNA (adenosine(37)-N6)-threonylcarbamoyltransferase complex dimerization subunit type 1 TsaB [Burkholderiales bacterium]|jgi:tRNA threonylcarbamoyladenosine biosynthesis protein TsaB
MHLLALETSTEYCSCALNVDGAVRETCVRAGQGHSALLLPMVAQLMGEAGLAFKQLDAIAFGAGPGSFTGLRIACGAAQGLAFAHELPVVPVVTLEALAQESGAERVLACLDARLGELYLAAYERTGEAQWKVCAAPALLKTTELPELPGAWTGVGSGFAMHGAALAARYALDAVNAELFPRAGAIAALAAIKFARREVLPADQAAPLYLRDKVALDVNEQAALRAERKHNAGGVAA